MFNQVISEIKYLINRYFTDTTWEYIHNTLIYNMRFIEYNRIDNSYYWFYPVSYQIKNLRFKYSSLPVQVQKDLSFNVVYRHDKFKQFYTRNQEKLNWHESYNQVINTINTVSLKHKEWDFIYYCLSKEKFENIPFYCPSYYYPLQVRYDYMYNKEIKHLSYNKWFSTHTQKSFAQISKQIEQCEDFYNPDDTIDVVVYRQQDDFINFINGRDPEYYYWYAFENSKLLELEQEIRKRNKLKYQEIIISRLSRQINLKIVPLLHNDYCVVRCINRLLGNQEVVKL